MADRNIGLITLNANFEVGFKGPLDARVSTPEYSHLTDGSIPYPYPGMVVAVTEDATADNNGLYLLTDTSATAGSNISHWEKVSSSSNAYITAVSDADGTQTITMSFSITALQHTHIHKCNTIPLRYYYHNSTFVYYTNFTTS